MLPCRLRSHQHLHMFVVVVHLKGLKERVVNNFEQVMFVGNLVAVAVVAVVVAVVTVVDMFAVDRVVAVVGVELLAVVVVVVVAHTHKCGLLAVVTGLGIHRYELVVIVVLVDDKYVSFGDVVCVGGAQQVGHHSVHIHL